MFVFILMERVRAYRCMRCRKVARNMGGEDKVLYQPPGPHLSPRLPAFVRKRQDLKDYPCPFQGLRESDRDSGGPRHGPV